MTAQNLSPKNLTPPPLTWEDGTQPRYQRRNILKMGLAAAGAAVVSSSDAVAAGEDGVAHPVPERNIVDTTALPFIHGVASGDPLPNAVILWTRVTPTPQAMPGLAGAEAPVRLAWRVAADATMQDIVASGEVVASAEDDFTVHVDAAGLSPATVYFYQFVVLEGAHTGAVSPVGRTQTVPAREAEVDHINLAFASCANFESGFFAAYRDMAQRAHAGEIDAVVFLGDYIYEYGNGGYAGKSGITRPHHPPHEIISLQDYRMRYGRYRTDVDVQAAHAAAPWVAVWDDHEVANDSWALGAENHTEGLEGEFRWRANVAHRAYFEWLPVRNPEPNSYGHIYRSLRFGRLIELAMLDLRTFRDNKVSQLHFADPQRTMLGAPQFAWLGGILAESEATWAVIGNSVMIHPVNAVNVDPGSPLRELLTALHLPVESVAINGDQWDGFAAERDRLLERVTQRSERGGQTLFLTGDIHSEWANSLLHGGREVACELVTSSISAPNADEILTQKTHIRHEEDSWLSQALEGHIRAANPTVKHVDYDAHGYSLVRVSAGELACQYLRVRNVEDPAAAVYVGAFLRWVPGQGFVA